MDGRNASEIVTDAVNQAVAQAVNQAVTQVQNAIRFADVDSDGSLTADRGVASASRASVGQYDVVFDADVSACAITATVVGDAAGDSTGYAAVQKTDARTLRVRTWQAIDTPDAAGEADGGNPLEDNDFHVVANC